MGIFNAVLSMACMTGAAIGGWLSSRWGYGAACGMAVATQALGLILMYKTLHAKWIWRQNKFYFSDGHC